ncbi:hypothetical protein KIPE111705_16330 [Kibdelosporangium persicum]|uniref:HEAT repeat domain-containing protein n=1 Tax=Kibdelosporangium persicum TaxID=2698649 RepID=A0ABX2EY75_9PSEU|nr:hypothetical protein [Kibdelosporangium persicum]NRN63954.1 hypothetical protein [Kibdelosporangium persicum]
MTSYLERRRHITERAPHADLAEVWDEDPDLALDMAEVVNHLPTLRRGLTSGVVDRQKRVAASSSLPRLDPRVVVEALPDLPMDVRRVLFRRVRSKRMTALADALLLPLHDSWGAYEAAQLLPVCSRQVVAEWLPKLEHVVSLSAIARRYPDLILAKAQAELPDADRDAWWGRNLVAVDEVIPHFPAEVLDLVEQFGPTTLMPFTQARSAYLAKVDAGRFLRVLRNRSYQLSRSAYRVLAEANPPELVWLGRQDALPVLRAMPPSRREAFWDAVNADKDMSQADIGFQTMHVLPRERRADEARRMRAIALKEGKENKANLLAQFLPYDEGRAILTELTYAGEATDRQLGYGLLVGCAAKDFRLAELLPWLVDRLKRDQDPVRVAAFRALTAASPRAFGEAAELTQLATDAFNARDLSVESTDALLRLCLKLLVHNDSQVALGIIEALWKRDSPTGLGRLDRMLRRGQEHDIYRVLAPVIHEHAARATYYPALVLAGSLGRRAWDMPDLLEPLWSAIKDGDDAEARSAIRYLLADPRARGERVERVLAIEPSAVFLPQVMNVVQSARTDLLDLVFGDEPPHGRFAPGDVRRIPLGMRQTQRWLPSQRARYAELLESLADSDHSREVRAAAVRTLGTVRGHNAIRYLSTEDELIAQAAITVLPLLPDPVEALRLLMDRALSDNRGQAELTAMYTIRRCARRIPPSVLAETLAVQGGRVTVRKELVRLISDFRLPDTVGMLHRAWHGENQHRDVRAAIAFQALSWLDDPRAWELLRTAVTGPREVAMQTLRVQPYSVPVQHRASVAALIHEVATGSDERLRGEALSQLSAWLPWYPEALPVLRDVITNLDERATWRAAVNGLIRLVWQPEIQAAVLDVLRTLATATGHDAQSDRDRPALQRMRAIFDGLYRMSSWRQRMHDFAGDLVEALSGVEEIRRELVQLKFATVRFSSPDESEPVADLRAVDALVAGRPLLASNAIWNVRARQWNADAMLTAARSVTSGHLALRLLAIGGPHFGWPERWRELLRELRRHPDADVRDAAMQIMTASE